MVLVLLWILFPWFTHSACVDIGNETRSCLEETVSGTIIEDFTVQCNETSGLYEVLDTTRCGDLPILFCRNGRSIRSFCLFASSCDYTRGLITDASIFTTSGVTKQVDCDGLTLTLDYTYDSDTGECRYALNETLNPLINSRLLIAFSNLAASTIWALHPGNAGGTDLHGTVPASPTLSGVCREIKSAASKEEYQCVSPFADVVGTFCVLPAAVFLSCNEHNLQCIRQMDDTYTCSNIGTDNVLDMSCSGVTVEQMALMISEYQLMRANDFTDLTNLTSPVNLIDGRPNSQCTEMALTCRDTPNSVDDHFDCAFPNVGPGNRLVNSSFCELAFTFQLLSVFCYGQQIACFNETSRTEPHLCLYDAGSLSMSCTVNASLLTTLYDLNDQLRVLLQNCTDTAGCNVADFQRLEVLRQRSLLSLPGSWEDESFFPLLESDPGIESRIRFLHALHQASSSVRRLRTLSVRRREPLLSLQVMHVHQDIRSDHVLSTEHGILRAGVHPHFALYASVISPSSVHSQDASIALAPMHKHHVQDWHHYAGRMGPCIDLSQRLATGCRGVFLYHPLPHLRAWQAQAVRPQPVFRMKTLEPSASPSHRAELFSSSSSSSSSTSSSVDRRRNEILRQRPTATAMARHLLWDETDVQTAYNDIIVPLDAEELAVCSAFLEVCSASEIVCPNNGLFSVMDKKSRDTFCTQSLAPSCQNFTGNMPTNVTRVFTTTNEPMEQYVVRCPVRDNPLPDFSDDTGASDSLFHDITCTRVPVTGQCYYLCVASTAILTLRAFPVRASVLLAPALTGFATGERTKCLEILSVAQNTAADEDNVFYCPLPYQTTYSTTLTNQNQNVTTVKDICVLSTLVSEIDLNCGEMLVTCERDFNTLLFSCTSNTYSCLVNGTCSGNLPRLVATQVPETILTALSLTQRCLQLRDVYATNFSCPLMGPCVVNPNTTCNRTNSANVFCSSTFDPNQAPNVIQFDCGQSADSNLTAPLTCTLNAVANASDPDTLFTYTCSQSYRPSQSPELSDYGFSLTSTPLTASCSQVEASTLAITFAPPNGAATDLLNFSVSITDPSDFARNLERCLFVKRSCTDTRDVFHCTCNFLQDTLSNEFCDVPGPATGGEGGSIQTVQVNDTLSCGETPVHSMVCSNSPNATGTLYGQWTRCTIPTTDVTVLGSVVRVSPGPLDLDCLVRTSQYSTSMLDNSTCELLRIQCQFPFSCDSALDCECPPTSISAQTLFTCRPPAQVCADNLCQFQETSFTNHTGINQTTEVFLGHDICDFQPPVFSLQCSSPPFGPQLRTEVLDLRTGELVPFPVYNITCVKQILGVNFLQQVLYSCSNDNVNNTDHEMFMNVTVPFRALRFFYLSPETACLSLGQAAVEANSIRCEGPFLSSLDYPYCSTALEDPSAILQNFTCDGLLITCTEDSDINRVRCFSEPESIYWQLGRNRDAVRFPNPSGFTGCILGPVQEYDSITKKVTNLGVPKQFYLNTEERCSNILHQCLHSCLDSATFNDTGVELLVTATQNLTICQSYLSGRTQFKCDTQDVQCLPVDLTAEQAGNLTAATGVIQGADFQRNNRYLNCTYIPTVETVFPGSLELQCLVNVFAFTQQPDTCRALISECRRTSGTIRCLGNYRRTDDAPFCTLQYTEQQARTLCDLGLWHSTTEGVGFVPRTAVDHTCYDYDLVNLWQGIVPSAGDPATDPDAGASAESQGGPPASLVLNRATNVALRAECALTPATYGLTCRDRGYISYDTFLRRWAALSGSITYEHLAYLHYRQNDENNEHKRYWCLWSYHEPFPICAVKPGMDLPMCTTECPLGLQETRLNGSRTRYCCRDPESCTIVDDTRNCVLGRHDPTCADQPWSCPGNDSTNPYLEDSVLLNLTQITVIRESQNVSLVPTQTCLENPLNHMSTFSLPNTRTLAQAQTFEKRFSQILTLIQGHLTTYDFVVIPDRVTGREGMLVLGRPAQLTFYNNPETTEEHLQTNLMASVDPGRRHDLSRTSSYHLHPTSDDTAHLFSSPLVSWPDPDVTSTTFFVERNYGFKCPDMRLNFVEYLDLNPGARARTLSLFQTHLRFVSRFLNQSDVNQLIRDMDFSTTTRLVQVIRLDARQNTFDHGGPNGSIRFPYRPYLQINLLQQMSLQLQLGISWNGSSVLTNATFVLDDTSGLILCNSSCPSVGAAEWRDLHPHFDVVKSQAPIWGYSNWDTDDFLESNPDSTLFVTIRSGFSGNAPTKVVQVGLYPIAPEVDVVQVPNFWYLIAYFAYLDWMVHGGVNTRMYNRASPSRICTLGTPLYVNGLLSTDGQSFGAENSNLCPQPVVGTYNWRTDGTSSSTQMIGPYPNPFHKPRRYNSIPCGGRGVCVSPRGALPGTGKCKCDAPFQVDTNLIDLGPDVFSPPSSIIFEACDVEDIRGVCTDDLASVGVICAGHGKCVSNFRNNRRIAECRCGGFPVDPNSRTRQRCNDLGNCYSARPQFVWQEGPWVNGDFTNNLCQLPRQGCRTPGTWNREGTAFNRGESHSCVLPPIETSSGMIYGTCELVPGYIDITADASWTCHCNTGQYGRLCEYFTLGNQCFDPDRERFTLPVGQVRSSVTDCIWNRHIQRIEPLSHTSLTLTGEFFTAPRFKCRGNACSGHGTCSHQGMNNDTAERWEKQPGAVLAFETSGELAFDALVLSRLSAQSCTCDEGWIGDFCQSRTCTGGCGNGTCVTDSTRPSAAPTCQCPRDAAGRLLVQGDRCEGLECGGRGILALNATSGSYRCDCQEPYVQMSRTVVCDFICDCTTLCGDAGPGEFALLGRMQLPGCQCTGGIEKLCNSNILAYGGNKTIS